MASDIDAIATELLAVLPDGPFDLLDTFARPLPVRVIARMIGIPEDRAPDLLNWSNAMVGMYQASRTRATEDAAVHASIAFRTYLESLIDARQRAPGDTLLDDLIAAEQAGDRLTRDELVTTVILLLNAGHEATVHTLGNGIKALLEHGQLFAARDPARLDTLIEEILRHDPPLHMFTRHAYEEVSLHGHTFRRGDQVACLLGSANRDADVFRDPDRFDPDRPIIANTSFGAGLHFCIGAPLARLELSRALSALARAAPDLRLAARPRFANIYHFHGLERLLVTR